METHQIYVTSSSRCKEQDYKVVAWVSRHPPLPVQIRVLEQKLGCIRIVQVSGRVPDAESLAGLLDSIGADIVVPVLPLTIIARLTEIGRRHRWTVLWAEMEQVKMLAHKPVANVDYDPYTETWVKGAEGTYKIMRFKKFHRIVRVKLELEPW